MITYEYCTRPLLRNEVSTWTLILYSSELCFSWRILSLCINKIGIYKSLMISTYTQLLTCWDIWKWEISVYYIRGSGDTALGNFLMIIPIRPLKSVISTLITFNLLCLELKPAKCLTKKVCNGQTSYFSIISQWSWTKRWKLEKDCGSTD